MFYLQACIIIDGADNAAIGCMCCRPGSKGMMQRYLPAQLRVAKSELQQGLQQHETCPDFLKKWFTGDAVGSAVTLG